VRAARRVRSRLGASDGRALQDLRRQANGWSPVGANNDKLYAALAACSSVSTCWRIHRVAGSRCDCAHLAPSRTAFRLQPESHAARECRRRRRRARILAWPAGFADCAALPAGSTTFGTILPYFYSEGDLVVTQFNLARNWVAGPSLPPVAVSVP